MSRRLVLLLTLCVLTATAVAIYPWTLSPTGPAQRLVRHLNKDYGLEVDIRGRSTLSLLPRPRIKVENVDIKGIGGRLTVRNATLRGHINWLSLLRGQLDLSDIALRDAQTSLDMRGTEEGFWTQWAAWAQLRSSIGSIRQLQTTNGSLTILRDQHPDILLTDVNSTTKWPGGGSPLSLTGRLTWNGQVITVADASMQPAALLSGKSGPFSLDISAFESRLAASGMVQVDRAHNMTFEGKSTFSSKSLRQLTQWADLPVPLSPMLESVAFEGAFTTSKNLISWPAVQMTLGKSLLEGSLAFRFDTNGHMVSGTLATDALDLTDYLAPLVRLPDENAGLSYRSLNRADLDLRLSATAGMIGSLKMSDLALGLIVKADRLEAALSRATVDNGTIKGRFLMTGTTPNKEIRLQGNIDNIDIARFLPARADGQAPLTGLARGQLSLDGTGADLQTILKNSHGRLTLSVANGEIRGVSLPAIARMKITEVQPFAATADTTRFTSATATLPINGGEAFVVDGALQFNGTHALMQGHVDFLKRLFAVKIMTDNNKTGEPETSLFVSGPWRAPQLKLHPGTVVVDPQ